MLYQLSSTTDTSSQVLNFTSSLRDVYPLPRASASNAGLESQPRGLEFRAVLTDLQPWRVWEEAQSVAASD